MGAGGGGGLVVALVGLRGRGGADAVERGEAPELGLEDRGVAAVDGEGHDPLSRRVALEPPRELRVGELRRPDAREQGNEIRPTTPEEFTKKVASDIAKWKQIVADRKIEVE